MNPLVTNAADHGQIKSAGRKQRWNRERELSDVRSILSTKQGRRFWWRYLAKCKIFQSTFTGNNTTFFNEGERNVGLQLLADLNEAMPEAYMLMQKEAIENEVVKSDKKEVAHETEPNEEN